MPGNVFTYGSLMFAPVWGRVVRGTYRSAAAQLAGYRRYALADDTYPGMVLQDGASVEGVLYFDVDDTDLAALDHFEGAEYRRCSVVLDTHTPTATAAHTYVFEAVQRLSQQPWDPASFALQRFLDSYCRDKLSD